jgi:hypothetical protein
VSHHYLVKTTGIVIAFCVAFAGLASRAAASTAYAITATNVTMPASGNGTSSFTVTGIPVTGSLIVSCIYSGQITGAKIPYCGGGPLAAIPVTGGQTFTGAVTLYPFGSAVPLSQHRTNGEGSSAAVLSLAGALLFGFGFKRRGSRDFIGLLVAICAFAILPIISACAIGNGMTPGTYAYTITAANEASLTSPPAQIASTTINVTVP